MLECDQWLQLGVHLGLGNDLLESIRKSQHPTAATLQAAKIKNIDMQWKDIVEALVSIGEYKLAESVCTQQGQQMTYIYIVHVLVYIEYCLRNPLLYLHHYSLRACVANYICYVVYK